MAEIEVQLRNLQKDLHSVRREVDHLRKLSRRRYGEARTVLDSVKSGVQRAGATAEGVVMERPVISIATGLALGCIMAYMAWHYLERSHH